MPRSPADEDLVNILTRTRTIAMVGASPKEARPSHQVMAYLQAAGYRVIPVNPGQAGKKILDETVYARLGDIGERVDMVDIFRRSEFVTPIVEEAIATGAQTVWMQLGIVNDEAAAIARAAGLAVVMDRCVKIEHRRLLPGS